MSLKKGRLPGSCTGCGACCKVVMLSSSAHHIRTHGANRDPQRMKAWARRLRRLSWAEALKRLPTLALWTDLEEQVEGGKTKLYRCLNFEEATNRCLIHERKPSICADFPWYDREPREFTLTGYPDCGFRADLNVKRQETAA